MRLRLSSLVERARASLFFVPLGAVIIAIGLGAGVLAIDRRPRTMATDPPLGFPSTISSARTLLATIAGATISFAGVAFSVSLLVIQLTSSQYSPRITHTLFRDPFNRRIVAVVVGTFTYCVVVLRSVRSALEDGGEPVIPNISVAVAVVLGVIPILSVLAFIDHRAHAMDVCEILARVRHETTERVRREWPPVGERQTPPPTPVPVWTDGTAVVRFDRTGWVQQIDLDKIAAVVPPATVVRLETKAGRYGIARAPICSLAPVPAGMAAVADGVRSSVWIGETRTMQQDPSYGLRLLVDIAVKALSPGINDPTTAQDAIFHVAAVLSEMMHRDLPAADVITDGRRVIAAEQPTYDDLVGLAFDEIRQAATAHPRVCVYLIAALGLLVEALEAVDLDERTEALRRQADLVLEGCGHDRHLDADAAQVRAAYDKRFGTD
ncbi:DUF2254 domain-containing protein [soil metagenome]